MLRLAVSWILLPWYFPLTKYFCFLFHLKLNYSVAYIILLYSEKTQNFQFQHSWLDCWGSSWSPGSYHAVCSVQQQSLWPQSQVCDACTVPWSMISMETVTRLLKHHPTQITSYRGAGLLSSAHRDNQHTCREHFCYFWTFIQLTTYALSFKWPRQQQKIPSSVI